MTQALVQQSQNLRGLLPDCLHKKTRLYRLAVAANHMSHYKFACFPTKPNTGVRSSGVCRHVEKKNLEPNVGQTLSDRDLVEGKTEIIQSNNSSPTLNEMLHEKTLSFRLLCPTYVFFCLSCSLRQSSCFRNFYVGAPRVTR
ncbi:unnamed protein product [Ixodes persulcatus]